MGQENGVKKRTKNRTEKDRQEIREKFGPNKK